MKAQGTSEPTVAPVRLLVLGAGGRGQTYASYARQHPDAAQVVGVAEPREVYRQRFAGENQVPSSDVFVGWREALARDRFADAVVICTQDAMHMEPALAAAGKGYHILLEKPMAPNEEDCRRIVAAAKASGKIFAVCHVMRYTRYTHEFKRILDSGDIGDVVSLQHLEPVGYLHQAHSYVRGNWRNEAKSSFMLLAKSCHDLDWIGYVMGGHCLRVSSFGSLFHFRKENQPKGAADRCLDCGVETTCPYSAIKIYLKAFERGDKGWPVDVLTPEVTEESLLLALREGPYGRCVYACDNDVVDNQVVNMEFDGGRTATFTMTAFCEGTGRRTRLFGTRGMIEGDGQMIRHFDFLSDKWTEINTESATSGSISDGHGGGDFELMKSFLAAVAADDPSKILSGPGATLESHLAVFAAERSRRNGTIERIVLK